MLQNGQIENFSGCYEEPIGREKKLSDPVTGRVWPRGWV